MKLFFVGGSKQEKLLFESDYVDDLYDVMISFFEEHRYYPHFIRFERCENHLFLYFTHTKECFLIKGIDSDCEEELRALFWENPIEK